MTSTLDFPNTKKDFRSLRRDIRLVVGVEVSEPTAQWPVYNDGEKLSGAETGNCNTLPCNTFHFAQT
jgi:hypothetical protein